MSIQFAQPLFFLLLIAVLLAAIFSFVKAKKIMRLTHLFESRSANSSTVSSVRIRLRILAWSFSWISAVIALAGPSWGTEPIPVQKSGSAVSFVFDISYSMTATDIPGKINVTRLDEAKQFAQDLLSRLAGTAISAILAKGDGILAVPLTEDYNEIGNLVNALSPNMLSAPGSSLASGILRAINSFPPQSARNSYIVVFSDGDETDDGLEQAVREAAGYGIQVIFVGFGSETETEILAGDGVTLVKTALRSEKLARIAKDDLVQYILASETSALPTIIDIIEPSNFFLDNTIMASAGTSYKMQIVKRHNLFLLTAFLFFIFGFCVYSFTPRHSFASAFFTVGKNKTLIILFAILPNFLFTGCSDWSQEAGRVLQGSYYWTQQDYQKATASFLEITTYSQEMSDTDLLQYGLFGLSAGYIMQGEDGASLTKLNEMSPDVPPALEFAHWYNKGIIFHRRGEYEIAAQCFKRALFVDGSNIGAKINLELCLEQATIKVQQGRQELIPVVEQSAPPGAEDAIFSLIKENEEKRWENQQVPPRQSDVIDY